MYDNHYSDDELIARLYGLDRGDDHLDRCFQCAERWQAVRNRQATRQAEEATIPEDFWRTQRQAIHTRLSEKPRVWRPWLSPVLAGAGAIILAILFLWQPFQPEPPVELISDAEIFEEIFRSAVRTEPVSFEPVKLLFEVEP